MHPIGVDADAPMRQDCVHAATVVMFRLRRAVFTCVTPSRFS